MNYKVAIRSVRETDRPQWKANQYKNWQSTNQNYLDMVKGEIDMTDFAGLSQAEKYLLVEIKKTAFDLDKQVRAMVSVLERK